MIRIRQSFDSTVVPDLKAAVLREILSSPCAKMVGKGDRIAVCVGSRGIHKISLITLSVIEALKSLGARPFILPAMGSHGGATEEGQREILAAYGVSERSMGVPIDASMETVFLGHTESMVPTYMAKAAHAADWVLPINRVKAHTDFTGHIESGLVKMLAVGLGKETGCTALHRCGTDRFAQIIPEVGRKILATGKIGFGLAIVENGYDQTASVHAISAGGLLDAEPELLRRSKAMMPRLPFSVIDVLIVEEFGKDISGAGMDPNITGRTSTGLMEGFAGPAIQRIVVLRLTKASHGNACAISAADFITRDFFNQIDLKATYTNSLACCNPASAKIPVIAETEEEAVSLAVASCRDIDPVAPRLVRIKNTLALDELLISESLLDEARKAQGVTIAG